MEKIMAVYWFAILFIVAGAVIYMAVLFYGQPYDVREFEAKSLAENVADCLVPDLYFDISKINDNFLDYCKINFNTEDFANWKQEGQYYLEVQISDFNTGEKLSLHLSKGNINLKDSCNLQKEKKSENLPLCFEGGFYAVDNVIPQRQYNITIISVVDKSEKNVN